MTRYRWLTLGGECRYTIAAGKGLDERRGESCRVLVLPTYAGKGPKNALVEFSDGLRVVCSAMNLRGLR